MAYTLPQYQTVEGSSGSTWGSILGGILGAVGGSFLGQPTLGAGIGSALGGKIGSYANEEYKIPMAREESLSDMLLRQLYADLFR